MTIYEHHKKYHNVEEIDYCLNLIENEYPEIYFNISHCAGAAVCIFGNTPVGIDIQDIRERNSRSVTRVCSSEEIRHIEDSAEPDLEFCRIWSVKESLSKLSGKGIFREIFLHAVKT